MDLTLNLKLITAYFEINLKTCFLKLCNNIWVCYVLSMSIIISYCQSIKRISSVNLQRANKITAYAANICKTLMIIVEKVIALFSFKWIAWREHLLALCNYSRERIWCHHYFNISFTKESMKETTCSFDNH